MNIYQTANAIYQKLKVTKRRLKYARQKGYLKNIIWNEKRTNPRYDFEEVKEYFNK